jgi:hypothetical protein
MGTTTRWSLLSQALIGPSALNLGKEDAFSETEGPEEAIFSESGEKDDDL